MSILSPASSLPRFADRLVCCLKHIKLSPLRALHSAESLEVPNENGRIGAARGEVSTVRREGDRVHRARGAGEEDGQVTWETPVSPRRYTGQSYGDPTTNLRRAARSRMHARGGQEEASEPW